MPHWPYRIPADLMTALGPARNRREWWRAFRVWARSNGLRVKIQWMPELESAMTHLDYLHFAATNQDRWDVIREWLETNGVEIPAGIPVEPEQGTGKAH